MEKLRKKSRSEGKSPMNKPVKGIASSTNASVDSKIVEPPIKEEEKDVEVLDDEVVEDADKDTLIEHSPLDEVKEEPK